MSPAAAKKEAPAAAQAEPKKKEKVLPSLYELSLEILALDELLAEAGGDISEGSGNEQLAKWLDEFDWMQATKVDNIGQYHAALKAQVEMYRAEAKKFQEKAGVTENKQKALRNRILEVMRLRDNPKTGVIFKELLGKLFKIRRVNNGGERPVGLLATQLAIPEEYRTPPAPPQLDVDKVRKVLEAAEAAALQLADAKKRGEKHPQEKLLEEAVKKAEDLKPFAYLEPRGEHVRIG